MLDIGTPVEPEGSVRKVVAEGVVAEGVVAIGEPEGLAEEVVVKGVVIYELYARFSTV